MRAVADLRHSPKKRIVGRESRGLGSRRSVELNFPSEFDRLCISFSSADFFLTSYQLFDFQDTPEPTLERFYVCSIPVVNEA